MSDRILKATHQGTLKIGDKELLCAVLEDGTRVITSRAVFHAFGRTVRGSRSGSPTLTENNDMIKVPSFMDAKNLKPFIDNDLGQLIKPIEYQNTNGRINSGYKAEVLPLICDLYLSARDAGVLTAKQLPLAAVSEMMVRSLSKVGIVALVDEATGYQIVREKEALQKLLELYIAKELLPWAKRFPDEFYKELFRLRGWQYSPLSVKRPQLVGKLTNDVIYKRLPPGVLEELQVKNPPNEKGRRKYRHHQFLTEGIGNPHLEKHLASVTALMRASTNWGGFKRLLERAYPLNAAVQLDLFGEPDNDIGEE
jgi:hypothetical protein